MATINYAAREINVKIVYYGPALSGKTTNLQIIHKKVPQESKSDMVSLATESDRTLFFDFLPIDLGKIKGFTTKIQLYTVPGQVYYNATRKLVLRGVDGIVFVADSSAGKLGENIESLDNMEENLTEYGYSLKTIPIVLQYNKRDVEDAMSVGELEDKLNRYNSRSVPAVARTGEGVFDTLKMISKEVIRVLNKKYEGAAASSMGTPSSGMRPTIRQSSVETMQSPMDDMPQYTPNTQQIPQPAPQIDDFDDFIDIPQATPAAAQRSNISYDNDGIDNIDPVIPAVQPAYESDFELNLNDDISNAPVRPSAKPAPAAAAYNDLDLSFDDVAIPAASAKPAPAPAAAAYNEISLDDSLDNDYQRSHQERDTHAREVAKGYDSDIQLDDAFDSQIETATRPAPSPIERSAQTTPHAPTTVIPSVNRVIETPPQPAQQPYMQSETHINTPIIEDVLDENNDIKPKKPAARTTRGSDPIKTALQNKYHDGWVPPEKMLFTSNDLDSRKAEHIIATKKRPINPKYKKSFLDNLFKKQQPE